MKWPHLSMDFPSKVLGASARLCCAHLLSRRRALFLLWAAGAPPGLITSSRLRRTWAWPRTALTENVLRRNEVDSAFSASSVLSCPCLPSWAQQISPLRQPGGGWGCGGRPTPHQRHRPRSHGLFQESLVFSQQVQPSPGQSHSRSGQFFLPLPGTQRSALQPSYLLLGWLLVPLCGWCTLFLSCWLFWSRAISWQGFLPQGWISAYPELSTGPFSLFPFCSIPLEGWIRRKGWKLPPRHLLRPTGTTEGIEGNYGDHATAHQCLLSWPSSRLEESLLWGVLMMSALQGFSLLLMTLQKRQMLSSFCFFYAVNKLNFNTLPCEIFAMVVANDQSSRLPCKMVYWLSNS